MPTVAPPGNGSGGAATPSLFFPDHVVKHAEEIWRLGELAEPSDGTRHDQRALHRAALLYLSIHEPQDSWPRTLTQHWRRLFGEKWATSEEGRGLRAVVRELGMEPKLEEARDVVLTTVAKRRA